MTTMSDQILRQPSVTAITGLSRSTVWRLERAGQFPPRRRLGPQAVGWVRSEIEAWIASRVPATSSSADVLDRLDSDLTVPLCGTAEEGEMSGPANPQDRSPGSGNVSLDQIKPGTDRDPGKDSGGAP